MQEVQKSQLGLRDNSIDIIKGVLVILMISAHVVQFFYGGTFSEHFSLYVNLTTFSGFMFCLGYVFPLAYAGKPNKEIKMFKGFCKTLIAFYISGLAHTLIVANKFSASTFFDILLLKYIPGYSEFLLSFAFVFAIGIFVFDYLLKLSEQPVKLFLIIAFCLALTNINYSVIYGGVVETFLGSGINPRFPIIQYAPYFLIGFYFSQRKIVFKWWAFAVSALCSLAFIAFRVRYGFFPSRFPPSLTWVVGASGFIYAYFLIAKLVKNFKPLSIIGKHSLIFLVTSNICIFIASSALKNSHIHIGLLRLFVFVGAMLVCFAVVIISYYIKKLIQKIKQLTIREPK